VAVLREQGVNSHVEMAYAFTQAGFEAFDVHMSDLHTGRTRLDDFQGLVACGGFSYGDTLGAGIGWARSITFNPALADQFQASSHARAPSAWGVQRLPDVCRAGRHHSRRAGLAALHDQPQRAFRGAPVDGRGAGQSPSLFLAGMAGSRLPIAVAHGEGFANFRHRGDAAR
jgi:phosphoribosylformylglycinamidine synthase